jgi:hypothetical protein
MTRRDARQVRRIALAAAILLLGIQGVAQATVGDSATGSGGTVAVPSFHFSAQSDPAGNDVKGTIRINQVVAEVTCLRVVGNTAVIGGDITKGTAVPGADGLIVFATDSGQPQGQGDTFALATAPDGPAVCPTPIPGSPLQNGDITVYDE